MFKRSILLMPMLFLAACAADNAAVYYNAAKLSAKLPDTPSAVKNYELSVKKSVHSQYYYEGLGDIYSEHGDFRSAVNEYTRSLRNKTAAEVHLKRGRAYMKLGFYPDAAHDFGTVIQLGGGSAYIAYAERAKAYIELGKYREALKDIDKAKGHDDISAELDRVLAEIYFKTADYDKAKVYIQRAVSASENNAELYFLRGRLFYKTRDANQALADYRKAVSLDSGFDEARRELAMVLASCPVSIYRNGAEALKIAESLFEKSADSDNASVLAAAYAENGDFDKAVSVLKQAAEKEKDFVKQDDIRVYIKAYSGKRTINSW